MKSQAKSKLLNVVRFRLAGHGNKKRELALEIRPKNLSVDFVSEVLRAAFVFLCETELLGHRATPRFTEFHRDTGVLPDI